MGVFSSAISAGRAHLKATDILREKFPDGEYSFREALKETWSTYLPPVISVSATVSAILGGSVLMNRKYSAAATAYALSQEMLSVYEENVKNIPGKKGETLRSNIAKDVIEERQASGQSMIVMGDNVKFCDSFSGRVFSSTVNKVEKAVNLINNNLVNGISGTSMNELYQALGLEQISMGDEFGWSEGNIIEVSFSSTILSNGEPAVLVSFSPTPNSDWFRHVY